MLLSRLPDRQCAGRADSQATPGASQGGRPNGGRLPVANEGSERAALPVRRHAVDRNASRDPPHPSGLPGDTGGHHQCGDDDEPGDDGRLGEGRGAPVVEVGAGSHGNGQHQIGEPFQSRASVPPPKRDRQHEPNQGRPGRHEGPVGCPGPERARALAEPGPRQHAEQQPCGESDSGQAVPTGGSGRFGKLRLRGVDQDGRQALGANDGSPDGGGAPQAQREPTDATPADTRDGRMVGAAARAGRGRFFWCLPHAPSVRVAGRVARACRAGLSGERRGHRRTNVATTVRKLNRSVRPYGLTSARRSA
jgi:hypothetical protein